MRKDCAPLGGDVTQNVDFQIWKVGLQGSNIFEQARLKKKELTKTHGHYRHMLKKFRTARAVNFFCQGAIWPKISIFVKTTSIRMQLDHTTTFKILLGFKKDELISFNISANTVGENKRSGHGDEKTM